jgi:hypothetical protein
VGRKARSALGALATGPDIDVFEDVPDTIPYFHGTDVVVYAPGPASGMKVKILEAFALGVPVVTTAEGVEGLPAEDGVHAGICDDDAGLIDRTVDLLRDPARAVRQCVAACALVESWCSPETTVRQMEEIHAIIDGRARRSHTH